MFGGWFEIVCTGMKTWAQARQSMEKMVTEGIQKEARAVWVVLVITSVS